MEYTQFGNQFVLKLDPDEEVMSTMIDFVSRAEIRGGYFIAFGGFERVNLQYFDIGSKEYKDNEVSQQVEVVSLMGNISLVDGKPKIHMHGAVADGNTRTYSGHVATGFVRPTLEVFLTKLDGEIRKVKDPSTGLDLLDLAKTVQEPTGQAEKKAA